MNSFSPQFQFPIGKLSFFITPDELTAGWNEHWSGDPFTAHLENFSREFVLEGMPYSKAFLFVRMVFAWGGPRGNNFKNFRDSVNDAEKRGKYLTSILFNAYSYSRMGKYRPAIRAFEGLNGIGISFSSKFLRFLCPDHAAILDSVIRKGLGYNDNEVDYEEFVNSCARVRGILNCNKWQHPLGRPWQITDVEMAIFMKLKA